MTCFYSVSMLALLFSLNVASGAVDQQQLIMTCDLDLLIGPLQGMGWALTDTEMPIPLSGIRGSACGVDQCSVGDAAMFKCSGDYPRYGYVHTICTHEGWSIFNRLCTENNQLGPGGVAGVLCFNYTCMGVFVTLVWAYLDLYEDIFEEDLFKEEAEEEESEEEEEEEEEEEGGSKLMGKVAEVKADVVPLTPPAYNHPIGKKFARKKDNVVPAVKGTWPPTGSGISIVSSQAPRGSVECITTFNSDIVQERDEDQPVYAPVGAPSGLIPQGTATSPGQLSGHPLLAPITLSSLGSGLPPLNTLRSTCLPPVTAYNDDMLGVAGLPAIASDRAEGGLPFASEPPPPGDHALASTLPPPENRSLASTPTSPPGCLSIAPTPPSPLSLSSPIS